MPEPRANRQWILVARPEKAIEESCFEWREGGPAPEPAEGQVLVRNLWLSFDPTQRGWMRMDTCAQLHGGYGFMKESMAGRAFVDLLGEGPWT